jgi:hypothetical protein
MRENPVFNAKTSFLNILITAGIAISSLLLPAALPAVQTSSTTKFTSKEGNFSVKMPGAPKETSNALVSPEMGPTTLHVFAVERNEGKLFYMIGYSDYQSSLRVESLQGVIQGQVESTKGKITSDKVSKVNGHAGRSVVIDGGDTLFFSSVYIAGNRLYQVMFGMTKGETMPADGREFLDSFEILK